MIDKYILKDKTPVKCDNLMEWAKNFESEESRRVAQTIIKKIRVSTVFLGIDHSFNGGTPILFETMIFGGKHDQYQERYSTWEQAEEGHKKAVKLVNQT